MVVSSTRGAKPDDECLLLALGCKWQHEERVRAHVAVAIVISRTRSEG